ncbi:hypothetical protein CGCFRS4_v008870 [Colletotrichum fructicola]|nr:hypothetical protein CGCFRS4_v008870 [Colletotrichum fructicola]KAF4932396.1 hypothetical protein CGCF245_v010689 [Colletotrichum fructicola]
MYLIWDLAQHNTTAQHSTARHKQHHSSTPSHPVGRVLPPKARLTSRLHRTALSPQCPQCPPPTGPLSRPPISPLPSLLPPLAAVVVVFVFVVVVLLLEKARYLARHPSHTKYYVPLSRIPLSLFLLLLLLFFSLASSSHANAFLSISLYPSLFFGRLVRPVSAPEAASTLSLPS